MSAKQLCDALTAAGFDGDDPLDPESLEWAFLQGDDSRRVLAWVCARLRPGHALSATDLELYEQLEMEGKLLEGEDLDFAFDSISAFSDDGDIQDYTFLSEESLEDIRLLLWNGSLIYLQHKLPPLPRERSTAHLLKLELSGNLLA